MQVEPTYQLAKFRDFNEKEIDLISGRVAGIYLLWGWENKDDVCQQVCFVGYGNDLRSEIKKHSSHLNFVKMCYDSSFNEKRAFEDACMAYHILKEVDSLRLLSEHPRPLEGQEWKCPIWNCSMGLEGRKSIDEGPLLKMNSAISQILKQIL